MKKVLFLSGLDPTGEAGILMDTKVASFLGVNYSGITTCLVVENASRVERILTLKSGDFESLLNTVFEEYHFECTKIGLVPEESLSWFVNLIERYRDRLGRIVFDPVISATSGYQFHKTITEDFRKLIFLVDIITPNYEEALKIAGKEVLPDEAGTMLLKAGAKAVIITGYLNGEKIRDYLFSESISLFHDSEFIQKKVRGTGCAFSAAIACFSVQGLSLEEAFYRAIELVKNGIRNAKLISEEVYALNFKK